ncbi:MAG TPA: SRPBCC family protein [Solirubrobacteraceae bacterium]|jgi:uncharacterized protein YndB with AHSA1/START domain|nr:SRPBCC family protein [Solirubrobacteraceae bacterium]
MPTTGSYEQVEGKPLVRFERTFPHAVSAVWDAVTDPRRLAQWFPTSVEFDVLRAGEPITFRFAEDRYPAMRGVLCEVQAPERLVFTWGADELTFELAEVGGGSACRLSLAVALDSADKAARDAAGWEQCLDRLTLVANGEEPMRPWPSESWQGYYDEYKRQGLPATAPMLE